MIQVVRGPEPVALADARTRRYPVALAAYQAFGAGSAQMRECLTGYDPPEVKLALYRAQRKKCAWCEDEARYSSSPVEHYRPKNGAQRSRRGEKPRLLSATHYWWLTWTWGNLLFSCVRCNDRGHKASLFRLVPGTAECAAIAMPGLPTTPADGDVGGESPLLLDPAVDDFLDHVRWKPSNTGMARNLWIWSPEGVTDRGDATIEDLKLSELGEVIQAHLLRCVLPFVEELEQHAKGKRWRQAAATWETLRARLEPSEPFTAATWCALEIWVPPAHRAAWKLVDPIRPR